MRLSHVLCYVSGVFAGLAVLSAGSTYWWFFTAACVAGAIAGLIIPTRKD